MNGDFLKFEEWEKTVPDFVKKDPLHNVAQLIHSAGSIFANMEEAFGRGVGKNKQLVTCAL